jgi:four helix bundle protein
MKIRKFEDIPIWKEAISLARNIYDVTSTGALSKDFGLRDQLRRSIISISSNIAEGFERNNNREFIRYLIIAKASSAEARNQIHLAVIFNYIDQQRGDEFISRLIKINASINGFIQYLKRFLKTSTKSANPRLR